VVVYIKQLKANRGKANRGEAGGCLGWLCQAVHRPRPCPGLPPVLMPLWPERLLFRICPLGPCWIAQNALRPRRTGQQPTGMVQGVQRISCRTQHRAARTTGLAMVTPPTRSMLGPLTFARREGVRIASPTPRRIRDSVATGSGCKWIIWLANDS